MTATIRPQFAALNRFSVEDALGVSASRKKNPAIVSLNFRFAEIQLIRAI